MTQNNNDSDRGLIKRPIVSPPLEGQGLLWHNQTDFYNNFFDLIEVMAIMVDMDGTIRMFNRKAEKLTGYSKAESLGQDCFSLLVPEHLRAGIREKILHGLENGQMPRTISTYITSKSGVMIPVDWNVNIVSDNDGKVSGLVGLGYLTVAMAPSAGAGNMGDNFFSYVEGMTHDLLNHSQVAMGYLELAIERADDDTDLKCMLNRACNAVKKCGNIAVNVHKLSGSPDTNGLDQLTNRPKR